MYIQMWESEWEDEITTDEKQPGDGGRQQSEHAHQVCAPIYLSIYLGIYVSDSEKINWSP